MANDYVGEIRTVLISSGRGRHVTVLGVVALLLLGGLSLSRHLIARPSAPSSPIEDRALRETQRRMDSSGGQIASGQAVEHAFWYSDDLFSFAQAYAGIAYDGDARAQYYEWSATAKCSGVLGLAQSLGNGDAYRGLEEEARVIPNPPEFVERTERREFRVCEGFLKADPFASLPPRSDGYSSGYWRARALESRDSLALIAAAIETSAYRSDDKEVAQQALEARRLAISHATRSGDPSVYYQLSSLLALPTSHVDELDALAWRLVACEHGFDCRVNNPRVGLGCLQNGSCASGETEFNKIQVANGPVAASKIMSRAQQIDALLVAKDYAMLERQFIR